MAVDFDQFEYTIKITQEQSIEITYGT